MVYSPGTQPGPTVPQTPPPPPPPPSPSGDPWGPVRLPPVPGKPG